MTAYRLLKRLVGHYSYCQGVSVDLHASARNRHYAKLALFSVQRGYIFRHGNSRLAASNILRSL